MMKMMVGEKRRCREFNGPTPHSVALEVQLLLVTCTGDFLLVVPQMAKPPLSRPADHLILQSQRREEARDQALGFTKDLQSCDIKASWLLSGERCFLRGAVERRVGAELQQHEENIHERRRRLRVLLEAEEQQLLQEIEEKEETVLEKQAKMRERTRILRERREQERQQLVTDKMDQLFREQCEDLRSVQSRRYEQQVCQDRAAQVRSRQEEQRRQQEEERLFEELLEADQQVKDQQEVLKVQQRQQRDSEQLQELRRQMEAAETQRKQERQLKEEEAQLRLQQNQTQVLEKQWKQQLKLQEQENWRRQLDRDLRLKLKRVAQEQQDELQMDMNFLQELLKQETDHRQEAANRKAELREEQQRYRQYLSEELQRNRKEEEETEQLLEEKLKQVWMKQEDKRRLDREARKRLMEEVMEARHLQIQNKLDVNLQKQAELQKEREELNQFVEEMNLKDKEERRSRRQVAAEYQADLQAQMAQQQQLRSLQTVQTLREDQHGLILEQLYRHRRDQILNQSESSTTIHPFRRTLMSSD